MKETLRSSPVGLIIRLKEPDNLETPFDQLDSFLTPTELFYIRSHFPAPRLEVGSYWLGIDGAVRNPLSLNYSELREMPSETRVAILECAGNGRVFLVPHAARIVKRSADSGIWPQRVTVALGVSLIPHAAFLAVWFAVLKLNPFSL